MSYLKDDDLIFESYYDGILKPCFKISRDVELKEVPTNGEEYLLKVIKERENYSNVSRANIDTAELAKLQNIFIEVKPEIGVSEKLKPTIEWQNIQVDDFSALRLDVQRIKQRKPRVPPPKQPLYSLRHWMNFMRNEPRLSVVLGLKPLKLEVGLEMITKLLDKIPHGNTIDHNLALWVYSLLACLSIAPITETTCVLRALARKCRQVRSRIDPDSENAAQDAIPLNLIICLISRCFNNQDLADV